MHTIKMVEKSYNGIIELPEDLQKIEHRKACLGFSFPAKQFHQKTFLPYETITIL